MANDDKAAPSLSRRSVLNRAAQTAAVAAVGAAVPASAQTVDGAAAPVLLETQNLRLAVDVENCRWSIAQKNGPMAIRDIYFLPGDDPSGWTVTSAINRSDDNRFGKFVTITLRGTKPGHLDFEYQVSIGKTGDDVLVSLGRTNRTGRPVDIEDMDYFVSGDARLGGMTDRWISLGTHSRNDDYYKLWTVQELVTPQLYAVNHLVRDRDSGNCLLMGHVTTLKGASRFEVRQGWQDAVQDRMQIRGFCSYKVRMPDGAQFAGEKLLINFNTDGLRAMEHQADLIAIAHDIRLRQRRPIDLDDREWIGSMYCRWFGWMSGGKRDVAQKFIEQHNLEAYHIGGANSTGGPHSGGMGVYGCGGAVRGRERQINYPAECYLPLKTPHYGGERVIDFSNPLTVRLEQERATKWAKTDPSRTGEVETDFSGWWDKWPGQHDPYKSALETYRAGGMPWREAIDKYAPRREVRSNMNVIDHTYGIVDVCRISSDADRGYESVQSTLLPPLPPFLFSDTVLGSANRFFYNGRVFWNDGDGFHVYKYVEPDGKHFTAEQAKVVANFRSIATNTILISEAFDEAYPPDRIELLKRISPPTMDVAYPVDLFVRQPAQVWNMPIERPFGRWNVIGIFNYTHLLKVEHLSNSLIQMLAGENDTPFSTELDAQKDLRLDPNKEYAVYEFWSRSFIGTFRGKFKPRPVKPYDCDIYSVVEVQDRPFLLSTSRHVRQMAVDIKATNYDANGLTGVSRSVPGDPYQLRIYAPEGFKATAFHLPDGNTGTLRQDGNMVTLDWVSQSDRDVEWQVLF